MIGGRYFGWIHGLVCSACMLFGAAPFPSWTASAGENEQEEAEQGWPTQRFDNQRSGVTPAELEFPLHLQWEYRLRHAPNPAWPEPARQDFWNRKSGLKARVTFDRGLQLVGDGDAVWFGHSADDQVYCLDAGDGALRWTTFTGGPVRLAPTLTEHGSIVFGSDDGFVYAVDARSGRRLWKSKPKEAGDLRIPGNGRLISLWPVRTGVLVDGMTGYFGAGLFPTQGAWHCALDVRDGRITDSKALDVSPQGYLEMRGDKLFVPTGRDPAGRFLDTLSRRGKAGKPVILKIREGYPFAFIGTRGHRIGGGDGKVAAFRIDDGKEIWSTPVEGAARSLAVAGGRLFVSTDAGVVYAFGSDDGEPTAVRRVQPTGEFAYSSVAHRERMRRMAATAVEKLGDNRGFALVLNAGDGSLVHALTEVAPRMRVIGVDGDASRVEQARRMLADAGVYGTHCAMHQLPGDTAIGELPYPDYLFNLIIDANGPVTEDHRQYLNPRNGIALGGGDSLPRELHAESPKGIGDWTHMYANPGNTACSGDTRVGGPMRLQWFGRPGPRDMLDRHHRSVPSLAKSGRLFIPGDERVTCVDAYNGFNLWETELPGSRRVGVLRDCGSMAATNDRLYVAAKPFCYVVDTNSGGIAARFPVPAAADGKPRHWGYLAAVGSGLVGSATKPDASLGDHSRVQINATYYDARPSVCSDTLFALDRRSGKTRWKYENRERGVIINPSIAINVGARRIVFVESRNPATRQESSGRLPLADTVEAMGCDLVALDLADGTESWRTPLDLRGPINTLFSLTAADTLALVHYRNHENKVWFDINAFDIATGKEKWSQSRNKGDAVNGGHGEQDRHPLIVGDLIIVEPLAFNLDSATQDEGFALKRPGHGCGSISASANNLFFRASNPTQFDLSSHQFTKTTSVSRPGCWINQIPAAGLLLIPESSSGCTCNFPIQTSMAFLPVSGK